MQDHRIAEDPPKLGASRDFLCHVGLKFLGSSAPKIRTPIHCYSRDTCWIVKSDKNNAEMLALPLDQQIVVWQYKYFSMQFERHRIPCSHARTHFIRAVCRGL
jgi:hypothetical protein